MNRKERIEYLVEYLNECNRMYYVMNSPIITDFEFDTLLSELDILEKETGYVLPYSPTQKVGSDLQTEFKNVERKRIMGSIANCYDFDELRKWVSGFANDKFIIEPKYDGISCSIIYEKGIFIQASTRGSGYVGSDVTVNVKTIKNIPLKLDVHESIRVIDGLYVPDKIEIRGEILLPKSELERINIERQNAGEVPFANERNAAAGSLKQLDSNITASRGLIFKPYAVYCEDTEFTKRFLNTQHDMLCVAENFGFDHPYFWLSDVNDVLKTVQWFGNDFISSQDYCMDGCVIKIDSFKRQEELGYTQKVPHWAKAFKFKQEQVSTKLKKVILQMGMSGQIGFVGEVDPVSVDGTVITRVTLNNMDYINVMGLQLNSYVFIQRNGGVIPGITGIDYERNLIENNVTYKIEEPKTCPFCGKPLVRKNEDGVHLYCVNPDCDERNIQKLIHFVEKGCMNIDGLSEKTIRKLYDLGIVRKWKDFIGKTPLDYFNAGLGKKTSEKIVDNFNKSISSLGADRAIVSMGIPMIGRVSAIKLIEKYEDTKSLVTAARNYNICVDGIGSVATKSFCDYVNENYEEMLDMIKYLPTCKNNENNTNVSDKLKGLKIMATGNLVNFSREGIKKSIVDNGGVYASGVNGKLDILIVGSEPGPNKISKAKELDIKMINETEYIEMIGGITSETHVVATNDSKNDESSFALF